MYNVEYRTRTHTADNQTYCVTFQVLTAANVRIIVFWYGAPCSLVDNTDVS